MTTSNHDWEKRSCLIDRIDVSILYNRMRERFLSSVSRVVTAIAIVGGSAAFSTVATPAVAQWAGLVVAATSTIALVFGVSDRARLHGELAARYTALLSNIAARGEYDFTSDDLAAWESSFYQIEMDEPAPLPTLVRICQNRTKRVAGQDSLTVPVPWWRRVTAQLF